MKQENMKKDALLQPGKCKARVEFFAIKNEIEELAAKGYSLIALHNYFKENKMITMNYQTFCRYIKADKALSAKTRPGSKATVGINSTGHATTATVAHNKQPNANNEGAAKTQPEGMRSSPLVLRKVETDPFLRKGPIDNDELF